MTRKKKIFWFILFGIIPYFLGRVINFYFKLMAYPKDKIIELIIYHIMFFYLGVFIIIVILGIILKIKDENENQ